MRTAEKFGPYRVERRIAVGGMAEIYLARKEGMEGVERTFVLKRILPNYASNDEFVTMFLDEARLMASLSHPNVTQVFDLGRADDTYYLVMEYVRGPTLGNMLVRAKRAGERGLPEKEALAIGVAIAEALAYVHERRDDLGRPLNIVHRDLNPSNVIVSYDGAVKLIDFGIAKAASKVYETRTGVIKGTFGYIAPEQLTRSTPVDHRADVFALGVILYEMLLGEHPFDATDELTLVDRILSGRYTRPRAIDPNFPPSLDQLIVSCLAPHPQGRPDDVKTLLRHLTQCMAERGHVGTMCDLADLAARVVPDDEGPAPLRPLTARQPRAPQPLDGSHTQRIAKPEGPSPRGAASAGGSRRPLSPPRRLPGALPEPLSEVTDAQAAAAEGQALADGVLATAHDVRTPEIAFEEATAPLGPAAALAHAQMKRALGKAVGKAPERPRTAGNADRGRVEAPPADDDDESQTVVASFAVPEGDEPTPRLGAGALDMTGSMLRLLDDLERETDGKGPPGPAAATYRLFGNDVPHESSANASAGASSRPAMPPTAHPYPDPAPLEAADTRIDDQSTTIHRGSIPPPAPTMEPDRSGVPRANVESRRAAITATPTPTPQLTSTKTVPRSRRPAGPWRSIAMAAGSIALIIGVGVVAFFTARAVTRPSRDRLPTQAGATVQSPDGAGEAEPGGGAATAPTATTMITVRSEPEGAAIFVDDQATGMVTPAMVPLPAGADTVWIRVVREGHRTDQRIVQAAVGEARFVLEPLLIDAGTVPAAGKAPPRRRQPRRPRRSNR